MIAAIRAQTRILADRTRPRGERIEALKFVVHSSSTFTSRCTAATPATAAQPLQVQYRGRGDNLHWLWDSLMLDDLEPPAYQRKLEALPLAILQPAAALPPDAAGWARESCAIVHRAGFYPDGHKIDAGYVDQWRPLAEERLRLAGSRLAMLLNTALAPP